MKKIKAFTCLVKPFARIWTRVKDYWLGCTRNPTTRVSPLVKTHAEPSSTIGLSHPSFASAHSYGFTLAEVLITLTILGVVAAITVPSLQKMNYKRTQISRMAKAYSSLEKAATNIAEKSGCIGKDLECTGLFKITNETQFRNKFIELSGFRVLNQAAANFYLKPIAYKAEPDNTVGHLMKAFVTTPDGIAYSVYKSSDINAKYQPDGSVIKGNSIIIQVLTDKKAIYDENNQIFGRGKISNAISGVNAFQFVMYDNFKVDPLCTVFGGGQWPLSLIKYNRFNKIGTASYMKEYCDPNKARVDGTTDYFDSCTCRIVVDGWKMNY